MSFIQRAFDWSRKRVYKTCTNEDMQLRMRLTKEEAKEAYDALHLVNTAINLCPSAYTKEEKYDALANAIKESFDQCFVAVGHLYCLGFEVQDVEYMFELCATSNDSRPAVKLRHGEKGEKGPDFVAAEESIKRYLESLGAKV